MVRRLVIKNNLSIAGKATITNGRWSDESPGQWFRQNFLYPLQSLREVVTETEEQHAGDDSSTG